MPPPYGGGGIKTRRGSGYADRRHSNSLYIVRIVAVVSRDGLLISVDWCVWYTETLKASARVAPDLLLKAVDQVKHKHRTTTYCDQLVDFVHSLPKPDDQ